MESSHSLPSLLQPERPRRQTQLPARYDEFIVQYGQRPQAPTAAQEQQPLYSADIFGAGPHYEPQPQCASEEEEEPLQPPLESMDEEEPEDAELPADNRSPPPSHTHTHTLTQSPTQTTHTPHSQSTHNH